MARVRSPNYPQIPLGSAIELVSQIHKAESKNYAPRDVVAKLIGYSGINGASLKKLGALTAYGLLERNKESELRVSDLAVTILFPDGEKDKKAAIDEAAFSPALFQEIKNKWPDGVFSDESLRAFLIRKDFNQNSVDQVIECYRSTISLVSAKTGMLNSQNDEESISEDEVPEMSGPNVNEVPKSNLPESSNFPQAIGKPIVFDMETVSGEYSFDNADDLTDFIEKLEKIKGLMPPKH